MSHSCPMTQMGPLDRSCHKEEGAARSETRDFMSGKRWHGVCLVKEHGGQTMSRQSQDEIRDGRVYNGFDYALQVWVVEGIIQAVGRGAALAGQSIYAVQGAEER